MEHRLQAEGFGVRLRPVRMSDAAFIVWLRNLEHARGRIGDSAATVEAQEAWLRNYFTRSGDYYFIIETEGRAPVGTYGLYDVADKSAESGRWVIRPEVLAAIPSAMLAFQIAFEQLGLDRVRARTVATNKNVLSLNKRFGFREVTIEPAGQSIGGVPVSIVHYILELEDWKHVRPKLLPLANLAEKQVREWAAAQGEAAAANA